MLYAFLFSFLLTSSPVADPVEEVSTEVVQEDVSSGDAAGSNSGSDVSVLAELLASIDENLEVMALDTTVDAYQVSDYYKEYFKGVLQNMGYTNYICYAERVPYENTNGYTSYVTHYYLLYDLDIINGQVVTGSYPCIDVYNSNNVYYLDEYEKEFEGYPTMGFASFAPYSALIDRSFDFRALYVGIICTLIFFLISRKSIFN